MAKNISLLGADYPDVPAVVLPQTGGGSATFIDVSGTTATVQDVAAGKQFYDSNGVLRTGELVVPIVVKETLWVSGGNATYENNAITTSSKILVQICRNDNGIWNGLNAYPRVNQNGEVVIYLRNTSDGSLANEGNITVVIAIFN